MRISNCASPILDWRTTGADWRKTACAGPLTTPVAPVIATSAGAGSQSNWRTKLAQFAFGAKADWRKIFAIFAVLITAACSQSDDIMGPPPYADSPYADIDIMAPPDPATDQPTTMTQAELARAHADLVSEGYTDAEATDAEHAMAWANRFSDRLDAYAAKP